jgi:hypothetical protein
VIGAKIFLTGGTGWKRGEGKNKPCFYPVHPCPLVQAFGLTIFVSLCGLACFFEDIKLSDII